MDALGRAWLALDGLSIGDAFGERFFGPPSEVGPRILRRELPVPPWTYTDDTEMALSIVEVLQERGGIEQDLLARRFAGRMQFNRNYGQGAYAVLCGVKDGLDWRLLTRIAFRGMGSFGNGAAMRVAPLGAFFADQPLGVVCDQARLSAEVTHAHAEGIAGAIAVAAAAACGATCNDRRGSESARQRLRRDGAGHRAVVSVDRRPCDPRLRAGVVGHGSALGDRDTTCAIVGGILALHGGPGEIPQHWLQSREPLPIGPAASCQPTNS